MNLSVLIYLNSQRFMLRNKKDFGKSELKKDIVQTIKPLSSFEMALDFFAGCLGGVAGVLVGHPFDTIKVHLQTQDPKNPKYTGTFHCMKTILATQKLSGLYRGITSPMLGVGLVNAIVFGVYGNVQRFYNDNQSLYGHTIAGAIAGLLQSFVCAPMELAKTRVQLQHLHPEAIQHKGPLQCFRHILATEGIRGSMRGFTLTALRDIPGFVGYFVSYEYIMQLPSKPNAFHNLLAGGVAGMFSWICCYPIDVIKTCVQADLAGPNAKYKSINDCVRIGYKNDGVRFFFRGINSTMLRAFPMNAATFFVVSLVMRLAKPNNVDLVVNSSNDLSIYSLESQHICLANHNENVVDEIAVINKYKENLAFDELLYSEFHESTIDQLCTNSSKNYDYYILKNKTLVQDKIEC